MILPEDMQSIPVMLSLPEWAAERMKLLEESLKDYVGKFTAWQDKIEFLLEQNGILLNQSPPPSPAFRNDFATGGLKIVACTSLSNPVSDSAGDTFAGDDEEDDEELDGDENIFITDVHQQELDSSDNELEINAGDVVFRSGDHELRSIDDIKASIAQTLQNRVIMSGIEDSGRRMITSSKHVELPPVEYSSLLEEESEIIDKDYGESPAQGPATRVLRSTSSSANSPTTVSVAKTQISEASSAAVRRTRSRSHPDEDPISPSSGPQLSTRFYKEQAEALNHIVHVTNGQARKYKCKLCGQVAVKEATILTHVRMSHIGNERKHPCPHCSYRFKLPVHLTRHVEIKHPGMESQSPEPNSLNIVLRRDQQDHGTYTLVKSGPSASNRTIAPKRTHEAAFSQNNDPGTERTVSRTPEDLEEEIQNSYDVFYDTDNSKRFLCIACGVIFVDEIMIRQHILRTHKCPLCPEVFMQAKNLQAHVQVCRGSTTSTTPPVPNNNSEGTPNKRAKPMTSKAYNHPHGFPEEVRKKIDEFLQNIKNSQPPYICKICDLVLSSTRQSARKHVRRKHPEVLSGLEYPIN